MDNMSLEKVKQDIEDGRGAVGFEQAAYLVDCLEDALQLIDDYETYGHRYCRFKLEKLQHKIRGRV